MINKDGLFVFPLLTNISLAYKNDDYLSEKLMPIVQVKKDTGQITTYGMDNLRITNSLRAQGSSTNEINHTVSIGAHYILKEHALKELVTKEEMENADKPINPQLDATENLVDRMWVIREKALADTMGNTAIMTNNVTIAGNDQWNNYSTSDPVGDIRTGIIAVKAQTGKLANTLVFAWDVWMQLLDHPDIKSRAEGAVVVDAEVVSKLLVKIFPHIKNIHVGTAMYNAGVEGGSDSLTEIWTKNSWVGYIEPRPTLKSRSFGFTYQRGASRFVDTLAMGASHETWDRKGMFVRVNDKYDQKLVDVKCLYLMKTSIA